MSCRTVRGWMHLPGEQLEESARLVLEAHLEDCEACRVERDQLARVRRVLGAIPVSSIGPRGHGRAIAKALIARHEAPSPQARRHPGVFALAALAVVALVLVVTLVATRGGARAREAVAVEAPGAVAPSPGPMPPAPPTPPTPPAPQAPALVVVSGLLAHAGGELAPGAALPTSTRLHARTSSIIKLYDVTVTIAASSDVMVGDHAVTIERGELAFDGELAVVMPRASATVAGRVEVTPTTVRVQHGTAAVALANQPAQKLAAGETFTVPEPVAEPAETARSLVARARAHYMRGAFDDAWRTADLALAARPSRPHAAEASTIAAESLQALGRLDLAAERYLAIARDHADLAAGETALFAAARLAVRQGHTADARALFDRYLVRYPDGRFATDARRGLQEVSP